MELFTDLQTSKKFTRCVISPARCSCQSKDEHDVRSLCFCARVHYRSESRPEPYRLRLQLHLKCTEGGATEYDLLMAHDVNVTKQLRWYAGRRVTRHLVRAVPWIGGIIAFATLRSAIRRKGFVGGSLHTALDMIPYVGSVKNLAEAGRGRDFIRDKRLAP